MSPIAHVLHIIVLLFTTPPSFFFYPFLFHLPPYLLFLYLFLLSFFAPPLGLQIPSHVYSAFPSILRHWMTPLPFIKLACRSDTAQASKRDVKNGKVMWMEREGNILSNPIIYIWSSLKHGLHLVSSTFFPPLKELSISIKENSGKRSRLSKQGLGVA